MRVIELLIRDSHSSGPWHEQPVLFKRKSGSYRKLDDSLSNSLDACRIRRSAQMMLPLCAKTQPSERRYTFTRVALWYPERGLLGRDNRTGELPQRYRNLGTQEGEKAIGLTVIESLMRSFRRPPPTTIVQEPCAKRAERRLPQLLSAQTSTSHRE